jgi:hypothetical protein
VWYVISIGSGLAIGLSLLIWGLRERSLRHKAELAREKLKSETVRLDRLGKDLEVRVHALQGSLMAERTACGNLRAVLAAARERLIACNDPQTIKVWLDGEMRDSDV